MCARAWVCVTYINTSIRLYYRFPRNTRINYFTTVFFFLMLAKVLPSVKHIAVRIISFAKVRTSALSVRIRVYASYWFRFFIYLNIYEKTYFFEYRTVFFFCCVCESRACARARCICLYGISAFLSCLFFRSRYYLFRGSDTYIHTVYPSHP